ncbi:class I SAM-dependent methyltransferase [Candidatus Parcubacteria bacterium]|nr:class I SAM-dependent methyltransferase [Candidatus Parcubacteria bacterium]
MLKILKNKKMVIINPKKYSVNHKNFKFNIKFPENLKYLKTKKYIIKKINLKNLYANIVIDKNKNKVKHKKTKIIDTPHFKYISGDKKPYLNYLQKYKESVGYKIEHSIESFDKLIEKNNYYLKKEYSSNYIICQKIKKIFTTKYIILDGVHRASLLLHQGIIDDIPMVLIIEDNSLKKQLDQYLNDYQNDFLEWYTPIKINDLIIHEQTYPNFKKRPEFFINKERGKSKWDFIIKKNLPNLKNKSVCDIGCNVGLYSIYMSEMGAKKVDGYDRSKKIVQPTNKNLPSQNVVQQAYFVKNLFFLAKNKELKNIDFFEKDISLLNFSTLKYDLLFSSCVLYHFGEKKFEEFIKKISNNIPEIFLQTNLGHKTGELAKTVNVSFQKKILQKYGYQVKIDAPENYNYPIIFGKKYL